jgi:hypothetical protein
MGAGIICKIVENLFSKCRIFFHPQPGKGIIEFQPSFDEKRR